MNKRIVFRSTVLSLCLVLAACSSTVGTSSTATPTNSPAPTETTAPSPTPEPIAVRWHSFYGGRAHSAWDLDLIDSLPTSEVPISLQYQAAALYAEPVPLEELESVLESEPSRDVISGFINGASLSRYAVEGGLLPITDLWEENGWFDVFPESIVQMASVEGEQYYLPHAVQWNPIWYRTDIFEEFDLQPPETWQGMLTLCQDLQAEGITPVTVSELGWRPPLARWFTILNLRLNGPDFHQELMAGNVPFDDPRVRDVFEHWLELYDAGCFEEPGENVNYGRALERFSTGEAAMYNLGEWIYEGLEPEVEAKIDFFRFPEINPEVPNGEIASVYGSYIPSASQQPEGARTFISHLGSVEVQQSVVEEVGRLVPDSRIEESVFPEYQRKGLTFLEESGQLVTLFEFNAFSEEMAEAGLDAFDEFYSAREESAIDPILAELEETRQAELQN